MTVAAQSKLTDKLIEQVETSLRVNASWSAAADYAGVTDRTLFRYRERAEAYQSRHTERSELSDETDPDEPYWQAVQRWQVARSRGELELVATARKMALEGNVQALLFLLKVGWPDRYNERLIVSGPDGGPVEISVEERTEALVERVKEHQARCAKKPSRKKNAPEAASA